MVKILLRTFFVAIIAVVLILQKADATGFSGPYGAPSVYWCATDPYGLVAGDNRLVAKYYPNPARDYITFEFDKKMENNCTLVIYSFTGSKMTETQISNLKVTVNLTDYFRGLYLFQLVSPKRQVLESGKFQVLK